MLPMNSIWMMPLMKTHMSKRWRARHYHPWSLLTNGWKRPIAHCWQCGNPVNTARATRERGRWFCTPRHARHYQERKRHV